jgi:hypothetical protein
MNRRYHRHPSRVQGRVSESYTGSSLLGTAMLAPRNPHQNRMLAECLFRMPSSRPT